MTDNGALRASHEDRDRVTEVLRVAAGDGRLSPEELDERLERALTAKTYDELAALTADLPVAPGTFPAVPGSAVTPAGEAAGLAGSPQPKDLIQIDIGSGSARRDGRWVVPKELDVKVGSGGVCLDFTEAVITQTVLRISAEIRSGALTLITKPGIVVDADDVSVRSGQVKIRAPWGDSIPASLRIEVTGSVRSGRILARPPRRTFWQWLRRAPRPWSIPA
ncbi:MAG: DUF1707 domain-containing protein [Nocardiopsaceae bacterium]|nr:DUF1707 domain-containing protein [Nocardiopsaceae bacterium]